MFYAIDRFEDTLAVLQDDDGKSVPVPRSLLPSGTMQGDVFELSDGRYLPAPEETARRRGNVRRLQERLLRRNNGGHL